MDDYFDWAYDMHMQEEYERELVEENIELFTQERLQSYFLDNPVLAEHADSALQRARALAGVDSTAALVFAGIAQELLLRDALLTPIVYGLVANESAAALITNQAVGRGSPSRFKDMILALLRDHCSVDLLTHKRKGENKALWEEVHGIVERRNSAVHRGTQFQQADASEAIAVAEELQSIVFPTAIAALGLHLHGVEVCGKNHTDTTATGKSGRGPIEHVGK